MAVGKIRKISSWTMLITMIISAVVFGLFYFGGLDEPLNGKWKNPSYTEELLFWLYIMLGICIASMLILGVMQFASKFKKNAKASLVSLAVFAGFALLLIIGYSLGDATPLSGINTSSQKYNVESWLRITDMWIYTIYIMLILATLLIIVGSIKKSLDK